MLEHLWSTPVLHEESPFTMDQLEELKQFTTERFRNHKAHPPRHALPDVPVKLRTQLNLFLPDHEMHAPVVWFEFKRWVDRTYRAYLKEAHRILEKEGKLILSTHGYWMFHPDPTDFWRWTSTGLKKIVTEAGFEVVYFEGILGRSAMGLQLFQDGLLFKLPKPLRFLLSLVLQPLIIFFDKIITAKSRNEDACTFVLVAKKV